VSPGDVAKRERALAVLLEVCEERGNPGRNSMAKVAAARAILESLPLPKPAAAPAVPGWSPTPESAPERQPEALPGQESDWGH
jgi:hypothetical protein